MKFQLKIKSQEERLKEDRKPYARPSRPHKNRRKYRREKEVDE